IFLHEPRCLKYVRRGDRSGRARTREGLSIAGRCAAHWEGDSRQALSKKFQRVKSIRAEEVSWEVVKDLVHDSVAAEFQRVMSVSPSHVVGILLMVNVCGARAEAVTANRQQSLTVVQYNGFRIRAVRYARLRIL